MKYVLSLVVVTILAGYTSTLNLSPRGTIAAAKPTESGIVASSAKYSYRFAHDGVPQECQRYKTFYECPHQQAFSIRVNFVAERHKVMAEYLMAMDQRKLDTGQRSELVNQCHVVQIDNDRLGVLFKATGSWTTSNTSDLAITYQLARLVVVSINDKTKMINSLGAVVAAPLSPFYMMYGRAIGSRV